MLVPPTTLRHDTRTAFTKMKSDSARFTYASGGRVIIREDEVIEGTLVVQAAVFLNIPEIEVFTEEEWNKYD